MKQLTHLSALSKAAFLFFIFLPLALFAQTSFVKYVGNPILPLGNPGAWDDTEAAFAHVSYDGTNYQMWYTGAPQENAYRIGYATSLDGNNWIKDAANPVLNVSGANTFDGIALWTPNVYSDGSGYHMWYSGGLTISGIGYATAPDPTSWCRQSSSPVLVKGGAGAWDQDYAYLPVVIRNDSLYQMWYTGRSASGIVQTGYATSTDGLNWSKYPNNPVLAAGAPGRWDAGGASAGSVIYADGQYHMWYFNWANPISDIKIGYATSNDGINWTKHAANPILWPGASGWDGKNVWFPTVIKDGHRYRMWYTGTPRGTTQDRLGYAEDFSNAAHTKSLRVHPNTVLAGSEIAYFEANIANPHSENLAAKAMILVNGTVVDSVYLSNTGNGLWQGNLWRPFEEANTYTVSIRLHNNSAGYMHYSSDWGVSAEFSVMPASPDQQTHIFRPLASINDGGEANDVVVGADGTVFLANGEDGLRAYTFDSSALTNTAHIDDGGFATGLALSADGSIFLANGEDGLRAYSFDGASFTNTAHINNSGKAERLAISSDGTIFLANGADGLRAYTYDGASFINTAHIDDNGIEGRGVARDVAVSADSTVFLANEWDYLNSYSYDGSSFDKIAHIGTISSATRVEVDPGGTVFLANSFNMIGPGSLEAYRFDGTSFSNIANVLLGGFFGDIKFAEDSTVFITKWYSLDAYSYKDTKLTTKAHIDVSGRARGLAVVADSVIFLAAGSDGLLVFSYEPDRSTAIAEGLSKIPADYALQQNYPNPFNPSTAIEFSLPQSSFVSLKIYNLLGVEVTTLLQAHKPAGRHTVTFDASALASGLYYYTLTAGDPSTGSGQDIKQTRKMLLLR